MNIPAASLIPHRPPMQFIESLIECTDTTARATASFPSNHFAVSDGLVLEAALIECVAQTVAAALGYRSKGSGSGPAVGMLAAVNDFQIHTRPAAGRHLEIAIREIKRLGPMRLIAGSITDAGQIVAAGELTVYA